MKQTSGYYSLIQFCPDPSRLEAANVGILLFVPSLGFLKAITTRDNRRVQQFFGRQGSDWVRLNSFKKGLEERIQVERTSIQSIEDLTNLISKFANKLRLTNPRPLIVSDPDKNIQELYAELVAGDQRIQHKKSLKSILGQRFQEAGLNNKIKTDLRIRVPSFEKDVTIPYGYQNGRFQLIRPASFESEDTEHVLPAACRYAVEGESLYKHKDENFGKLQLVIVGQFPAKKTRSRVVVRRILEDRNVRLFSSDEVDKLVRDIKKNAKELPI